MIEEISVLPVLRDDYYSRKIRAHYKAYGTDYDFMKFYKIGENAVLSKFNSGVVISSGGNFDMNELMFFLETLCPSEIETDSEIFIPHYEKVKRTLFSFPDVSLDEEIEVDNNPKLDDVFSVLKTGFDIEDVYSEWLTDTSHRIRHGVSKVYLYGKTTATMQFCDENNAFFGMIATHPSDRGKGKARKLLYHLKNEYKRECTLFAKDERVSFYEGAGFIKKGEDYIYIRRKDF